MSNSNFNITKVTVDPTSQEITNLEINGKAFESGGEVNLEEKVFDSETPLNVTHLFSGKPDELVIGPSSGYDGLESVTIQPGGLTGYPGEGLEIKEDQYVNAQWTAIARTITIPEGEAWTGTITINPEEQP